MNTNHKDCRLQLNHPEIIYVLTSGDIEGHYDSIHGEGSYDKLTDDQKRDMNRYARQGLDGYMEERNVVFDFAIEEAGLSTDLEGVKNE